MKRILFFCLIGLMASCGEGTPGGGLSWTNDTISRSTANDVVALIYPLAQGPAAADSINAHVRDYLKEVFTNDIPGPSLSLAASVDSLLAQKSRDTFLSDRPFQLHSEGSVYSRGGMSSLWLQTYAFTGGAHGMTLGRMLNVDNASGRVLTTGELFRDTVRLAELNREAFKRFLREKGIERVEESLFVSPDTLPLPTEIGLDSTGVVMLYNPYEIAPYVFGQSVYSLPYAEVESLLQKIAKK